MKSLKKVLTLITAVIMVTALFAGCGSKSTSSGSSAQSGQAEYAIVLKTLSNPFWVSMKEGIEKEAAAKGVKVDIFAVNSESDTQGQLQTLENLLSKNYKGIGVAPLSPVNLIQTVAQASKKGIYVINIDEKLDMDQLKAAGGSVIAFVTTDNKKVGAKAAQFIVDKIGSQGGKVAIIEGQAGNASGDDRKNGASGVFKSNSSIKLVASQPADWDRAKALDVAANILQTNPDLKAFYCANDTMALGAEQAVINAGKAGKVLVVGTDGDPEALQSIKDGKMNATVAQDPAQIGAKSLDLLINAVQSKQAISADKEPDFVAIDSNLITK